MRIAINGTFWQRQDTGSGQYLRQLEAALRRVSPEDEFTLLMPGGQGAARSGGASCPPSQPEMRTLATPFDGLNENLAKLWFEQVTLPRACARRPETGRPETEFLKETRFLSSQPVDVLHVPYFAPPWRAPVPVVVTIHDVIPLLLPAYRGSALVRGYTRLVVRAARHAALVLTDSQASARDIVRLLRVPSERVQVVYLAVEASYRPLAPEVWQPVLARLGVSQPYLLYLGGFDVRKNLDGLLRAYARARNKLGQMRLVIAGRLPKADSAFAPDPRRLARQLGLEDVVCYTGWVDEADKPALYAGATAFVFPSHYEGFGLPVLEAIACGTPAIVGAGSSLEEIAGPGGLVVPPTDVEALADAMVRMVNDAALRGQLAEQGLVHARGFSWDRAARETLEAYRRAAGCRVYNTA